SRLKYGEYAIPPQTTPRQLLALFASGKVRHYSLTFVEGWSFRQMLDAISREPALSHHIDGKPPREIMELIDAPGEDAEGRFYPDTYFFAKGTDDLDLLRRAYRKMQTVLAEEWQGRAADLAVRSPYEALILASIVEKETGLPAERAKIAGVFSRRLAKGMLLQTDPTVIYGMGETYAGNIRKEDLLRDTPFNTYQHTGLPPTPIAMPGLAALHAALHPEPGDSLYFVARGDGGHVFSKTLAEHNQAVEQYQKHKGQHE
ncbi:MAG: endolytic transglycosylase MltG, partial [Candidatus Methylumidiphilus sp.]